MSEELEALQKSRRIHGLGDQYGVTLPDGDVAEILSALKTVQGIEGLAKESGDQVRIEMHSKHYNVTVITRNVYATFQGSTLSLAVEAAVGADEIGGK